jgi:uncharacterized protein (TIRG00374 family)
MSGDLISRFQRWVVVAIAVGAACYLGSFLWGGWADVLAALRAFQPIYLLPVVLLTLANYALRFVKWHYYLRLLGVEMPWREDALVFTAGLSMAISPAKAGELLKPWLVRQRTGATLDKTIPALVSERATDGIAMVILTAFGIATYASEQVGALLVLAGGLVAGLVVLASAPITFALLDLAARVPVVGPRVVPRLRAMYTAARTCFAPVPLVVSVALSVVAWFAECVAFWLVFVGLGHPASLDAATYVYASSTILGAPSPGGLGVTDGALVVGAVQILGAPDAIAVPGAVVARLVTLWMGVLLGTVALFSVSSRLRAPIELPPRGGGAAGP